MATRPQTIGYSLLDSPVGLAAWLLDHDTDSYYKIARAFVDGEPVGSLTRDRIVDNITLYWLTGTGSLGGPVVLGGRTSAGRSACVRPGSSGGLASRSASPRSPARSGASPRSWVEAVLPQRHLLQRGRQGRPLRRLGRAAAVLGGAPSCLQLTALIRPDERRARPCAPLAGPYRSNVGLIPLAWASTQLCRTMPTERLRRCSAELVGCNLTCRSTTAAV